MIKTWFTESAIGLDITDSGITAVSMSSSGLFGPERFVVDNIYHFARRPNETDADLLNRIAKQFPSKTPIIPVAYPAVCSKTKTNTVTAETVNHFHDAIKPLIETGGHTWFDIDNILAADTGDVKRTIHAINHLKTIDAADVFIFNGADLESYLDQVAKLTTAQALAGTLPEAMALREEIAFFQAVRVSLIKLTRAGASLSRFEKEAALRQLVA